MKFDPKKVISEQEMHHLVYTVLGFEEVTQGILEHALEEEQQGEYDALLQVGHLDCLSVQDALIQFMEVWVKRIDKFLRLLQEETAPKYQAMAKRLRFERGFTYKEYLHVFEPNIPEEAYSHYPSFVFLGIQTRGLRRHFSTAHTSDVQGYIELLPTLRLTVWDFFLKRLGAIIPRSELCKHGYIGGKTGSGKSELIKAMIYRLQKKSQKKLSDSIILIEPHGDLASEVRQFHLNKNPERVIYIDPYFEAGYTPTINPLELPYDKYGERIDDENTINLISEELVKVFQELLNDTTLSNQREFFIVLRHLGLNFNNLIRLEECFRGDDSWLDVDEVIRAYPCE